jgi:hypothetical protein
VRLIVLSQFLAEAVKERAGFFGASISGLELEMRQIRVQADGRLPVSPYRFVVPIHLYFSLRAKNRGLHSGSSFYPDRKE